MTPCIHNSQTVSEESEASEQMAVLPETRKATCGLIRGWKLACQMQPHACRTVFELCPELTVQCRVSFRKVPIWRFRAALKPISGNTVFHLPQYLCLRASQTMRGSRCAQSTSNNSNSQQKRGNGQRNAQRARAQYSDQNVT
eukprot:6225055-Amphidinium_carterae.1